MPKTSKYLAKMREQPPTEAAPVTKLPPTVSPFAPVEIIEACHKRGIPTTSFGWPIDYRPADWEPELKAWREREPPKNPEIDLKP